MNTSNKELVILPKKDSKVKDLVLGIIVIGVAIFIEFCNFNIEKKTLFVTIGAHLITIFMLYFAYLCFCDVRHKPIVINDKGVQLGHYGFYDWNDIDFAYVDKHYYSGRKQRISYWRFTVNFHDKNGSKDYNFLSLDNYEYIDPANLKRVVVAYSGRHIADYQNVVADEVLSNNEKAGDDKMDRQAYQAKVDCYVPIIRTEYDSLSNVSSLFIFTLGGIFLVLLVLMYSELGHYIHNQDKTVYHVLGGLLAVTFISAINYFVKKNTYGLLQQIKRNQYLSSLSDKEFYEFVAIAKNETKYKPVTKCVVNFWLTLSLVFLVASIAVGGYIFLYLF